jgi:LmbE family N-acetylglucosaminyl deacetylase
MTDLWLSPHNDDETLFGAFTIIREKPMVIVCLKSQVQEDRYGIKANVREMETTGALWWLGNPSWQQLLTLDTDPQAPAKLLDDFASLDLIHAPERVWAPAYEENGHEQHNVVSYAANGVFGDRVQPYLTYKRGSMRSRGTEVPFEPKWAWQKLRALACYQSQVELENTMPWFIDDTFREYVP